MSQSNVSKNILFSFMIIAMVMVVIEVFSCTFFTIRKSRFSFSNPTEFTLTDNEIATVTEEFDYHLGWKTVNKTPFGERPREITYDEDLMSTFGDSYTYGAEVQDNETWQTYLSKILNKNIYNFGNGAYGPGQTLLRFRADHKKIEPPFITFGLITENINRLVNIYRKFYLPSTGIPATKPRFFLDDGKLALLNNPIQNIGELQKLKDEGFLSEIGANDFWYNQNNRPRFSFPYSAIFLNKNIWTELRHGQRGDETRRGTQIGKNLWQDQEVLKLLFAIIDSFVEETIRAGATPVILIFPLEFEINYRIQSGRVPPAILTLLNYCQSKRVNVYCPIDELATELLRRKDINLFAKGGHYSVDGNKILSRHLHRYFSTIQKDNKGRI